VGVDDSGQVHVVGLAVAVAGGLELQGCRGLARLPLGGSFP
jgi:hypothetical protein